MKSVYILAVMFSMPLVSHAGFSGVLVLEPEGCEKVRVCYTKYSLRFTETDGTGWEAKAGLKTDGATIPFWAQPFIGKPYDKSFLKAAVVHDHYSDRHVRPWRQTHRAFYKMLRSMEVPEIKSKVMYYAVFIGGPKWIKLVPGNNCGSKCLNKFNRLGASEKYLSEPESYSRLSDISERLKRMESVLVEKDLSLDEIDNVAISESPDNWYYIRGSTYPYNPNVGIER